MSCNSCKTKVCSCNSTLGGNVIYDGIGFQCIDSSDGTTILWEIKAGDNINYIFDLLATQICGLISGASSSGSSGGFSTFKFFVDSPAPNPEIGNPGDLYLQTTNQNIYQKVDDVDWGVPLVNVKGSPGANGSNGTSLRTGTGVPSNGLGANGDTYLDLASPLIDIYTKAGGVWTDTTLNFKGDTGAAGTNGTNGTNGADGDDGLSFIQGSGVPSPATGNDGDSYLDYLTGDVYLKTGGTWSITFNMFNGPIGLVNLFSVGKVTEEEVSGANDTQQLVFADQTSVGRFNYGNSWVSDTWKASADIDNVSFRGIFNLKVTGVDGGSDNDVTITVKKGGISIGTSVIPVPAATPNDTIINHSFQIPQAFFAEDSLVTVEISTANDPVYATFVGEIQVGSIFYNVQL